MSISKLFLTAEGTFTIYRPGVMEKLYPHQLKNGSPKNATEFTATLRASGYAAKAVADQKPRTSPGLGASLRAACVFHRTLNYRINLDVAAQGSIPQVGARKQQSPGEREHASSDPRTRTPSVPLIDQLIKEITFSSITDTAVAGYSKRRRKRKDAPTSTQKKKGRTAKDDYDNFYQEYGVFIDIVDFTAMFLNAYKRGKQFVSISPSKHPAALAAAAIGGAVLGIAEYQLADASAEATLSALPSLF